MNQKINQNIRTAWLNNLQTNQNNQKIREAWY